MMRFLPRSVRAYAVAALSAAAIPVAGAIAVPVTTTGCTTHQCDTLSTDFYGGRMVDANTYETSDWNEDWIPYPGEVTVHVHFPPGITRAPVSVDSYVGTGISPNGGQDFQGGDVWTSTPGLLAEVVFLDQTGFYVTNASCAGYYARFVVHFAPAELTLFGGLGASADGGAATLDDTWSWNGVGWAGQGSAPSAGPEPRERATLGTVNASPFLYGGFDDDNQTYLVDSWTWNGVAWTQVYSATYPWPTARADAASAVIGNQLVLFGGHGPDPTSGNLEDFGDTWAWNGTSWTPLAVDAGPAPGPRSGASAAAFGGRMLLFGGSANGTLLDDTWVWDGSTWAQITTSGPSARFHAAAASLGSEVLLFGGDGGSGPLADTWLWDGVTWAAQNLDGPGARSEAAAAAFEGAALLFGGNQAGTFLSDTWTWGAGGWTQQASGPSPRAGAVATGP